ncbi:maleylpyruvate isomerase N-terminal domain-containing protein [Streptomyces sp. NPDC090080]|uniref:maleylpyruvate isomerase N-terminal domain-containing protein n=1 Tax=Streptomyces sp. NPDC090080 TaxID=3365939 RepID=UPI00381D0E11
MSAEGLAGLKASISDARDLFRKLDEREWDEQSAATGWSVRSVGLHLGDLLAVLMSAVRGELTTDLGIERLNDQHVAEKSDRSVAWIRDEFERQSVAALEVFEGLQNEPYASTEVPYLDLGTYPLHTMPDLCAFDFYTHLRWDVLAPRGPLRRMLPEPDAVRLNPAVAWLLQGLPRMQPGLLDHLNQPLELVLTGPAGGKWTLYPGQKAIEVLPADVTAPTGAVAQVQSTTHLFTAWATTRLPWRDQVTVSGDALAAARFLDALNLV